MVKSGWIKSIRGKNSKTLKFLSVAGTEKVGALTEYQITIPASATITGELKVGASFICEGVDSMTPNNSYEFLVSEFTIVGKSDDEFPIQPKEHSKDFLRTIPELRGRTKEFQAIWRIRHTVSQLIHQFFDRKEFYQYYAPIITKADCEGAGETFAVKTDWMDASLTVSAQLQGEVGMMSLGKIYTFGPCFRAEKSSTKKHLSEFWMVEPEAAFYDLEKTMDLAEQMLDHIFTVARQTCAVDLYAIGFTEREDKNHLILGRIQRLTYQQIIEEFDVPYGQDISNEIEKKITDKYGPTFVTHYPAELKPFYMKKKDGKAICFDLIMPHVGELIGGSEREDDYETLKLEMEKAGLDMEKMQWYLDTRRWGSIPHAGFGIGLERLIAYIVKAEKVHDVIPFPLSY